MSNLPPEELVEAIQAELRRTLPHLSERAMRRLTAKRLATLEREAAERAREIGPLSPREQQWAEAVVQRISGKGNG